MFTFGHDGASTPCKGLRQRLFEVENWFEQLAMAAKTKGHLKAVMHRLFECAMKWALFPLGRNPMELVEIKDVTKRQKPPRVLTHDEFWNLVKFLQEPYRTMVLVAQCLGLRISEGMALVERLRFHQPDSSGAAWGRARTGRCCEGVFQRRSSARPRACRDSAELETGSVRQRPKVGSSRILAR